MQACDAVLASKDAVINEIIAELKFKDEEYQIAIEQQAKDINDLCTIMARQVLRWFLFFVVEVIRLARVAWLSHHLFVAKKAQKQMFYELITEVLTSFFCSLEIVD
jgi:hypothetical protein